MTKNFKKLILSNAMKSAFYTSSAQFVKLLASFVFLKVVAIFLGPEGFGKIGHFLNLVTMATLLAGGGITNAVIKYVSEYSIISEERLDRFLSSATTYSFGISSFFLLIFAIFSKHIATLVFADESKYKVIIFLGLAQCFFSFLNLVVGTLNGLKKTFDFAVIQITGCLISIPIMWFLTSNYGVSGAALSIVVLNVMSFFPAFLYFKRSVFYKSISLVKIQLSEFKQLSSFSLMLVASAMTAPVVEIIIRRWIISSLGYGIAGEWQAIGRLSSAYLSFFNIFLAYYFVPIISSEISWNKVFNLTSRFLVVILTTFTVFALCFYLAKGTIIPLFLSSSFNEVGKFLGYQLLIDFFRIGSYVIGFVIIAKAATKIFILAEIIQSAFLLIGVYLCRTNQNFNLELIMKTQLLVTFIYFTICLSAFFFYVKTRRGSEC